MFLKSLTLKGFKSFADKAQLSLEPGITAVVGPNGSGKSNISDAILWVLGERNAKHLRGTAMEDVIFAGSSARKATSFAEVELVLDNTDKTFPVDYSEVSVARRMYRTGESEYLINGSVARRMDVLDILHDTGLGTGTHSIISQGSIDEVLSSKPENRRELIEEAAGVLKHKQRMAKSSRKLERMETSVARVGDIVAEVAKQLGPLERKAKRAEKYEELAEELAQKKLSLLVDDLRKVQASYEDIGLKERHLEEELVGRKASLELIEAQSAELSEKMRKATENAGEITARVRNISSAADRISSTLAVVRDRRRAARTRGSEIEIEIATNEAQIERLDEMLKQAKSSLEISSAQSKSTGLQAKSIKESLDGIVDRKSSITEGISRLKGEYSKLERELASAREQKTKASEAIASNQAHLKVLEGHTSELELIAKRYEADAKNADSEAKSVASMLADMEAQESNAREMVSKCMTARTAATEALEQAKVSEQAIKAQIAALEAIDAKRSEGDNARIWIEERAKQSGFELNDISHIIRPQKGYEALVELLLGSDIDSLVMDSLEDAKSVLSALQAANEPGEATIMVSHDKARDGSGKPATGDADVRKGSAQGFPCLLEFVDFPPEYGNIVDALLGDVVVCDSIDSAISAHEGDAGAHRFSVLDGSIVWPSGKISVGLAMYDEDQGKLARIRQTEELKADLKGAIAVSESAQEDVQKAEDVLVNAQKDSLQLSEKLAELRGSVQSLQSQAKSANEKYESALRELKDANEARIKADESIAKAAPDALRLDDEIERLEKKLGAVGQERIDKETELAPLEAKYSELTQSLQEARLASAKADERRIYDERMVERHTQDFRQAKSNVDDAKASLGKKRASSVRLEKLGSLFDIIEAQARKCVARIEKDATELQVGTADMHLQAEKLRKSSHEAQAALDETNERLSGARVEKARLEMQVKTCIDEIVQGCNMPLEHCLQAPELSPEERSEAEEARGRIEKRIAALGTINPDAANEYKELKARYDYLASQLADLSGATRTLAKINRLIESRMKDDFVNTFEEINDNFQEVFSMLFPGGTAHLSLVDPEDIENTGVEVNAQPKGKRISKMSLMSGGEKSLTALALLFALYRTRPTPFYVLDEVEAALDDSNLRRLTGFINAMRDTTQLIMITHQRRTMEMADVLFGVSMGSDGVTKVISQKLEAALRHAE